MISETYLKTLLRYYPTSGLFRRLVQKGANGPRGCVAGCVGVHGYVHIKIDGHAYKAHRLAWFYMTGVWPAEDVEHKDRNKSNNRWKNLRLSDDSKNQANTSRRSDNTSGFKSVHFRKDSGKYRARLQVRGKRLALGCFDTAEAAHAAYIVAAKQHFGEFARVA